MGNHQRVSRQTLLKQGQLTDHAEIDTGLARSRVSTLEETAGIQPPPEEDDDDVLEVIDVDKAEDGEGGDGEGGDPQPEIEAAAEPRPGVRFTRPDPKAPAIQMKNPEPKADEPTVVVRFKGPMRSYVLHRQHFERGNSYRVPVHVAQRLLATDYFVRGENDEVPQGMKAVPTPNTKKWRPGQFETKQAALDYAMQVHGIPLDGGQSLRKLNEATANLAKGAVNFKGSADGTGVVTPLMR